MMTPVRKENFLCVPFDLSASADLAGWKSLLVDGANLEGFQEYDRIYDSLTTLCLELRQTPSGELEWSARDGLVCRYIAAEDLPAHRWVSPLNDGSNTWRLCNTDGEGNPAITLTAAQAGERVYVIEHGSYLLEAGPFPFNLPAALSTDVLGRGRPVSGVGEFYAAYNTNFVTVDGTLYLIANLQMPIIVV